MMKPTESLDWQRSSFCASSSCVEVASAGNEVYLRDSKHLETPPMEFTMAEWSAFLAGARGGEFDFA